MASLHNVYVGAPVENESERAVLKQLLPLLDARGVAASLLVNINVAGRQIDLVVGTDDLTLVIEAKGGSAPLRGSLNGPWLALTRSGRWKNVRNAYLQALQAKNALRDAMREQEGDIAGYPDACVVFAPRIPVDSAIPEDDFKVRFSSLSNLVDQIKGKSQLCWNPAQWREFARRHALYEVDGIEQACDEKFTEARRILDEYTMAFNATYTPMAARYKCDKYSVDGQPGAIGPVEIENIVLKERSDLLIQGPSGCGKSLLSLWLASRLLAANVVPIVIECRTFDGHLSVPIGRETALLDVTSAGTLLAAARMHFRSIALIVDGYNECPQSIRFLLTRTLRAASSKYDAMVLISSQIDIERPDLLPLRKVRVSVPSLDLKTKISDLDAASLEALDPLLKVVNTGIEAQLVGQLRHDVLPNSSRFAVFDTFVRHRLGNLASEGIALLCDIATLLFQRGTFSLATREVDRIMAKAGLRSEIVLLAHSAGALNTRAGRVSFVHEMYLNAFTAEAVVRHHGTDLHGMIKALEMPRFEPVRTLIIGAIEDQSLLAKLITTTADVVVLAACVSGECGRIAQELAGNELASAYARLNSEIEAVRFTIAPPQMWEVGPAPESLTAWTAHERALLSVLSAEIRHGKWVREMLALLGRVDELLAKEFRRLRQDAIDSGVKRLRTGLFAATYVFGQRDLGIGHIMSLLHSGADFDRESYNRFQVGALSDVWEAVVTPGQLYFALTLSHAHLMEGELLDLAVSRTLPLLQIDEWKYIPYHLQLEILNFLHFFHGEKSSFRELLSFALSALLDELHPLLQGVALEALARLGAVDDDIARHETEVRVELKRILSDPETEESAGIAWGLYSAQFDHPFDTAYVEAIGSLSHEQRLKLIRLACAGGSDISLFLSSAIDELGSSRDPLAGAAIARWAGLPNPQASMPQQAVEVYIASAIGLGKLGVDLSGEASVRYHSPQAKAMAACGLLYYWLQRQPNVVGSNDGQLVAALDTLTSEPSVAIGVLYDISRSMWGDSSGRNVQLIRAFPQEMLAIARGALVQSGPLCGYFSWRHPEDSVEAQIFAISIIEQFGATIDLPLLRSFLDDSQLASASRRALKSIEARAM